MHISQCFFTVYFGIIHRSDAIFMKHMTHFFLANQCHSFLHIPKTFSASPITYHLFFPVKVGVNITARYDLALRVPRGPFRVHKTMNNRVLVLRLVPGFDDQVGV